MSPMVALILKNSVIVEILQQNNAAIVQILHRKITVIMLNFRTRNAVNLGM